MKKFITIVAIVLLIIFMGLSVDNLNCEVVAVSSKYIPHDPTICTVIEDENNVN